MEETAGEGERRVVVVTWVEKVVWKTNGASNLWMAIFGGLGMLGEVEGPSRLQLPIFSQLPGSPSLRCETC